jgi:hypothetical protein
VTALETALLATVVLAACGRSSVYIPDFAPHRCRAPADGAVGCAFALAPSLNLSDLFGAPEPDGVIVTHAGPDTIEIQAFVVESGDLEEQPLGTRVYLRPGERAMIPLPTLPRPSVSQRAEGGFIRVVGDGPFAAVQYAPARAFVGNDSTLLQPDAVQGRRYVVTTYPPHYLHFQGVGEPSYVHVLAHADDTKVRFLPRHVDTAAGGDGVDAVPAGQWSDWIELDRNESILVVPDADVTASHDRRDLSGTVIEASAPVQATVGTRCAAVPISADPRHNCDPMLEQAIAVEHWGRTYVAAHPPLRVDESHHLRIYAGASSLTITASGEGLDTTFALPELGEYRELEVAHGSNVVVTADGPVMVVGYLQSRELEDPVGGSAGLGDPAMYPFTAVEQFDDHYALATGIGWDTHFVQLVRPGGEAEVLLDDTPVVDWETVGDWKMAIVEVDEGTHELRATVPFGVTQFGINNSRRDACVPFSPTGTCQTSYAHAGGMRTRVLQ